MAAPQSPMARPPAASARIAACTSASATVTVPAIPARSDGHPVCEISAQSRPAIVVPGFSTGVRRPAASDAVRQAAVCGSTPTTAMPAWAPYRAAAAASAPAPTGTSITSNRPCAAVSAKSVW